MTFILNKIEYKIDDPDLFRKLRINRAPEKKLRESKIKHLADEYIEYCKKYDKCMFCDDVKPVELLNKQGTRVFCNDHKEEYEKYKKDIRQKSLKTVEDNAESFTKKFKIYKYNDPDLFFKLTQDDVRVAHVPLKIRDQFREYRNNNSKCMYCKNIFNHKDMIIKGNLRVCKEHEHYISEHAKEYTAKSLKTTREKYTVEEIANKIKQTKLERYGDAGFNNLKKIQKTNLERYGSVTPLLNDEVKYKIKQTKLERYGDEYFTNFEKAKQTNLERYGSETVLGSAHHIQKTKETKLERYGDSNYNNMEKIKETKLDLYGDEYYNNPEKIKETKLELYGDEYYNNMDKNRQTKLERYGDEYYNNVEKIKETNLKKYNTEFLYGSEYFINKSKETKLEKYGDEYYNNMDKNRQTKLELYGNSNYNNMDKNRQTKLERYGDENYNNPEEAKKTSIEKYGVSHYNQMHIKNMDNYNEEYIRDNFIKDGYFLKDEFMEYFNISTFAMFNKKKEFNITEPNKTEKHKTQTFLFDSINNIIKENNLSYKTAINDRSLGFEMDIYIPEINLAIEYNGLMFHSQGISKCSMFNTPDFDKNYHLKKTRICSENNIQLFHIFEGEDLDLWLSMIRNKLGVNEKVFARKCRVIELSSSQVKDFLDNNHIQGYIPAKINLGLVYNNQLIQVMTFSKPRFNKMYEFELIRLCSSRSVNVVGGASKLLSYFKKTYKPKSIISYANRRFSNGLIYEKLGFKLIGESSPNYFYFKDTSTLLESRNKYQKHKLSKLLDIYDENLTEQQNMFNNNYRRIFDCGNLVYELIGD